jgi:hypothetical protein
MVDKTEPVSSEVAADLKEQSDAESRMRRALGLVAGTTVGRSGRVVTIEHRGTRNLRAP